MLALLADENFNGNIVRGIVRRRKEVDIVRVQDVGLSGANDPDVLAWAAEQHRILLTHDVNTITYHAFARLAERLPMSGVFEVKRSLEIGLAIEDIILLIECSMTGEWDGQILYLPL